MRMNTFQRNCPDCGKVMTYTSQSGYDYGKTRNSKCTSCCQRVYDSPKKCVDCGVPILRVSTRCRSCSRKGKFNWVKRNGGLKPDTIRKLKEIGSGKNHFNYGKSLSASTKRKISLAHKRENLTDEQIKNYRIGAMKRVSRMRNECSKLAHNYNPIACRFFEKLNAELGWNGVHAMSSGGEHSIQELGYFLDYYEPTQNVVIEWDEPYHKRKKQRIKDAEKQTQIVDLLKCHFYRVKQYEMDFDLLTRLKNGSPYHLSEITLCHDCHAELHPSLNFK